MGLKPRQWAILLTFYTTYLIFGACVFYHIEHNAETERRAEALRARIDINELLVSFASPDDIQIQKAILDRLSSYCSKPVTDYREDEFVDPYQWTFYHSVFFAFIVCSTLGYGNITPSGTLGRYFMIAYALVGMPVNMILYTYLGEYFGSTFIKVYRKYKASKFARSMHSSDNGHESQHRWMMICQITLSLVLPALVILVFLPSLLFTYFEGWDYSISVYYSFVTLLTIGFGDFVPTFQPHQERTFGIYFAFYQIFILVWFIFGLSYILMLIGFIARGMQHKKIRRFEEQLADNIKMTHNRIWHGVSKDVGYLRRILNEIYIMRVRPVFTEPSDVQCGFRLNRSQSCPEFTLFSCKSPIPQRRRALSEHFCNDDKFAEAVNQRPLQLQSRHSETNLMRIDKEKTFMQQNVLDNTGELLAQVVFALNSFHPPVEETPAAPSTNGAGGGIDLFSDESILEDEWSIITTPSDQIRSNQKPVHLRSRAKSLHPQVPKHSNPIETSTPQFTWSGNNSDIQEYINAQVKGDKKTMAKKEGVVICIDKSKEADANANRRKSIFTVFNNVFKRRNTTATANAEAPAEATEPSPSLAKANTTPASDAKSSMKTDATRNTESVRRQSILSNLSTSSEVLENTTIADLIRAIESAHVKHMLSAKPHDSFGNRRVSLLSQAARRGSVSFSSPLETPPSAGANRLNPRKSSMAIPRNRFLAMRQNSTPNRFSVTPVNTPTLETPSSVMSLSPIIQRRMRRFSAVPSTTMMQQRKSSFSLQATPLAIRRMQFKQTISPLAMTPPPQTAFNGSKNVKASISTLSKALSKELDLPE